MISRHFSGGGGHGGVSTLTLNRELGVSYLTARLMHHKFNKPWPNATGTISSEDSWS